MLEFTKRMKNALACAVDTYGTQRQVCVAAEELCELAAALMKYARYDKHEDAVDGMRDKVTDEVADVFVILHQLYSIFGLTDEDVMHRAEAKVARLEGWLHKSNSLQQSTVDREVPEDPYPRRCENCDWVGDNAMCDTCENFSKYTYRQY